MEKLIITCIKNPFDLTKREIKLVDEGHSLGEMIDDFYCGGARGYDMVVAVDGNVLEISNPGEFVPKAGTSVAFCLVPQGGGGGGKNVLRIVAILAVVVLSVYTGGAAAALYGGYATAGGAIAGGLASGAVMMVGGLIVNALLPPAIPESAMGNYSSSPTYGWGVGGNSLYEGGVLPEVFGTLRVVPPLIGKFVETIGAKQYMNLLYAVAGHQVDDISGVRINMVSSSNFSEVEIETRLGGLDQTLVPFFSDSRYDNPVGAMLLDPVTVNIAGISGSSTVLTIEATAHGFSNNQFVDIVGVVGVTNLNGYTYRISNVTTNTFDISYVDNGSGAFGGVWVSGGSATNGWVQRTTSGNTVDGFGVGLLFPQGLFYANDSGSLSPQTVELLLEFQSTVPGSTWKRISGSNPLNTRLSVVTSRWSAGFPYGARWIELTVGSTNYADHTEGAIYVPSDWTAVTDTLGNPISMRQCKWHWLGAGKEIWSVGSTIGDYVSITGKQTEPLRQVFFRDNITPPGEFNIRMRIKNPRQTGSRYGNDMQFEFVQEVNYDAFTYPNVALLAVRALATDQLSGGLPRVDCLVTRSTVPVWIDGAYVSKPASNPAWACYHILHQATPIRSV